MSGLCAAFKPLLIRVDFPPLQFGCATSAVDAHVGSFIFNEMLCRTLRKKTRILVTNQVCSVLPHGV